MRVKGKGDIVNNKRGKKEQSEAAKIRETRTKKLKSIARQSASGTERVNDEAGNSKNARRKKEKERWRGKKQ